ncbi:MAG: ribosome recycling factor [Patescibacteria group bacterium]
MFTFDDFQNRAQKILDHIQQDISSLRTGRAHTSLLDPVVVEAYGTRMKISELATVTVQDPTMLVVSPWDKSLLETIAKGIQISGLNLNPVVDSEIIRIGIPALTTERRQEMVKLLAQKIEGGKVMLRNLRGDIRKEIENLKGTDSVSEDNIENWLEELDKKVKELELKIDDVKKRKETDLMTI